MTSSIRIFEIFITVIVDLFVWWSPAILNIIHWLMLSTSYVLPIMCIWLVGVDWFLLMLFLKSALVSLLVWHIIAFIHIIKAVITHTMFICRIWVEIDIHWLVSFIWVISIWVILTVESSRLFLILKLIWVCDTTTSIWYLLWSVHLPSWIIFMLQGLMLVHAPFIPAVSLIHYRCFKNTK